MSISEKRPSVARATAWSTAGALMRMTINFAGMVILARLVAPQAFGVFAVASSLVLLVAYLSEIGSSWALIQHERIRPDHAGSALVLALGTSAAVSSLLALSADPLADFMRMPDLQLAILAMCLIIPIQAASGIPRALLRRAMNFGRLVRVDVVAAMTGLVCGLAHALTAPSYLSLLIQAMTYQTVLAFGLWTKQARSAVGRPTKKGYRELLAFAGGQTFYEVMMVVAKNLDTFLIARLVGAVPLGLYSRAFALIFTPLGQVYTALGSVAFSAMSRHQDEPAKLHVIHRKFLLGCIAGFALPLSVFAAFSSEFVVVVLGEAWSDSAPVLGVLAVAAALQVIYANLLWVLQATAQLQTQIRAGALLASVNVVGFVVAASTKELTHFAIAYVAGTAAALGYALRALARTLGISVKSYAGGIGLVVLGVPMGQCLHFALGELFTSPAGVLGGYVLVTLIVILGIAIVFRKQVLIVMNRLISKKATI